MSKKMILKRVSVIVLVLVIGFVFLIGCGQDNSKSNSEPAKKEASSTEKKAESSSSSNGEKKTEKQPLVGFANKSINYYFFVIQQEGLKRAVEDRGWKFEAAVADFDSAVQTNQFINFIPKKPVAIVSDPIDSEGLIDAVNKSVDAGIPVGIVDTPTTGGNVAITVAFNNKIAGELAAKEIIKKLEEKYGEPKGIVVNAYGAMSSWAWRLRKEGFDEVMANYPNVTYLPMPGEGDLTKTHDVLINALAKYETVDAVHCPSDTPARGLAEALKQKDMWKKVGEEGHVIFVTIDGEPVGINNVKAGYYDATVVQDAISYGEITMELLEKYTFNGEDIPYGPYVNDKYFWKEAKIIESPSGPYCEVPAYVCDASNADDPRHWGTIAEKDWGFEYK